MLFFDMGKASADNNATADELHVETGLRMAHHGRRQRRQSRTRQLHQSGVTPPGHRDHVEAPYHRRRRPNLQAHRDRPEILAQEVKDL